MNKIKRRWLWIVSAIAVLGIGIIAVVFLAMHKDSNNNSSSANPTVTSSDSPSASPSGSPTLSPGHNLTLSPTAVPTQNAQSSNNPQSQLLSGPQFQGPGIPLSDANGPQDVVTKLFPTGSGGVTCLAQGHYDNCPVTQELAANLDTHKLKGAEQLCRCQNTWTSVTYGAPIAPPAAYTSNPSYTVIPVRLNFGSYTYTVNLLIAKTTYGWLADDTYCGTPPTYIRISATPGLC